MHRARMVKATQRILTRWVPGRLRRAVLRLLTGDAKIAVAARRAARRIELKSLPLLSVVMPVYNVEAFLRDAIDSVLAQTYSHLEIILVDDGATDSSGAICDEYAARHKNIIVIHQANGGLGNARNVGARKATGTYLAFIDSDDLLYPNSYELMVRSLERTGSQLVTGNVTRFNSARTWPGWNQKSSHGQDRAAIRIDDCPELVYDTTAWNKMFRRDFFEQTSVFFPERKLYEDMVPMLKAMLDAPALDVLSANVYLWRRRDGNDSITQRRNELVNLKDKIEMMQRSHDLLKGSGHDEMLDLFVEKTFAGDLYFYSRHALADKEFDEEFANAVRWFWPTHSHHAIERLEFHQRVYYSAIIAHGLEVAEAYLNWSIDNKFSLPTRAVGGQIFVDFDRTGLDLPRLPESAWELFAESQVEVTATSVQWVAGRLRLEGWAYIPHDEDPRGQDIGIDAVDPAGQRLALTVMPTASVEATRFSKDEVRLHDNTGFEAWLSPESLATGGLATPLEFEVTVRRGDLIRTAPIVDIRRTGAVRGLTAQPIDGWKKANVVQAPGSPLRLEVLPSRAQATAVDLAGRQITADFSIAAGLTAAAAWIENDRGLVRRPAPISPISPGHYRVVVTVPTSSSAKSVDWFLVADLSDGTSHRIDLPASVELDSSKGTGALWLDRHVAGHLTVADRPQVAEVDAITILADKRIRLVGTAVADVDLEFGIGSLRADPSEWIAAARDGRQFDVTLDAGAVGSDGVRRPIKSDRWIFHVRNADPTARQDRRSDWTLRASFGCAEHTPVSAAQHDVNIRVYLSGGRTIRMRIDPPLRPHELSAYWQARFAAQAREKALTSPENASFMTTYFGFEAADSPRAIHAELGRRYPAMTRYWGVVDHSVVLPEGGVPVIKKSEEWYRAIAAATYLFNNVGSIYRGYERLPHQIDIQTWHGTPLKIIGKPLKIDEGKRTDEMDREGKQWDYLVSQSPYYSATIAADLGTDAVILETGYPRNDELFTTGPEHLAEVRRLLGIAADVKVALYAPTWRDNTRTGFSAPLFEALDLDALSASLGDDWVVLLRGHGFNARANDGSRSRNAVIDVTLHPSINELYLVSDLLITDYSSAMFDYANTGRPMLFYVPDFDSYTAMRRTYLDLRDVAPGPLLYTQDDLHAALARLDQFEPEFGEKYAAFKQRFAPWDDGSATARVVDAVIGKPRPAKG